MKNAGAYCYTVMPFRLKNAGATFQRLVDKVFEVQIGKSIEVYVDHILIKSRSVKTYQSDLEETFQKIRSSGIKLKPEKCTFEVTEGMFLGYLISENGIKLHPEKVEAITKMRPPKTLKELQRLNGRVATLNRFISKSADKCKPFFKILRNPSKQRKSKFFKKASKS